MSIRVRVLHDELSAAQQTGARTGLVAVLGLDLEQRERQVLVRAVQVLDHQREHLLVGGPEKVVTALAVLQPEQVGAVLGPAVRRLVRLPGQQRREPHLLRADRDHFFADDLLDLREHLEAQRQPRVDARRGAADVAGAYEPAVARHLGIGRVLPQRADEQLRHLLDGHGHSW